MLLIAGSSEDPQICHLLARAQNRDDPIFWFNTDATTTDLNWELPSGKLAVGNRQIEPGSAFVRQDVFRYLRTKNEDDRQNARAWKIFLDGYLWSSPDIRIFNRNFLMRDDVNKPLALKWASEVGLTIPQTQMHNSKSRANTQLSRHATIYKPIGGGGYCQQLTEETFKLFHSDSLNRPYIYQQMMKPPEVRIFRVGDQFMAFDVSSEELDYRVAQKGHAKLTRIEVPDHLIEPLRQLLDRLGLNYSAADFKTSPDTGELCFLEANSNPMFAAFDMAADYALTDMMLDWLLASK